jgi:hypothetical protein
MQNQQLTICLTVLVFLSLILAIMSYKLAKEKGRNIILWTILGLIPVINWFCVWYFVGAVNSKLEKKIEHIIQQ